MKTRTWFNIHSFTGVITGLLLFVICWSGSFAVLSHEIDWLITPEMRVEPTGDRASWGTLYSSVQTAYPDGEITGITNPPEIDMEHTALLAYVSLPDGTSATVRVNPYTAELRGPYSGFDVARFFRDFHTHLFSLGLSKLGYGSRFGSYLVEFFGLVMLLSLLSALYFYKNWWTRFFDFRWTRSGRAFWSQFHKLGGLWSIWFLLVISITGVWYLYETGQRDITGGPLNYGGTANFAKVVVPPPTSDPSIPKLPLDSLVAKAQRAFPDLDIHTISYGWYTDHESTVYFEGSTGFPLVRDRANQIWLDQRSGEVLMQHSWTEIPAYWIWSNAADPLHFGNFGGLTSKIIWFVFGLILCGLILSGTYLHTRRVGKTAGNGDRYRWSGTSAAIVVTLIILFVGVPTGFYQQVASYLGPNTDSTLIVNKIVPGVKWVIIGWTSLTIAIICGWIYMLWKPGNFAMENKTTSKKKKIRKLSTTGSANKTKGQNGTVTNKTETTVSDSGNRQD